MLLLRPRANRLFAAVLVATAFFASSAISVSGAAGASVPSGECDAIAQASGACLGVFGYSGMQPVEAAVTSALAGGETAKAKRFFSLYGSRVDPATRQRISTAFSLERQTRGAGSDFLIANSGLQPADVRDLRGDCCATGPYSWRQYATYNYGYYDSSGNHWVGAQTVDLNTTIYFHPQVHYYSYLEHVWGVNAEVKYYTVNMWEDIPNSPDEHIATFSCPSGWMNISCPDQIRNGQAEHNEYFYNEMEWWNYPTGYPADFAKFQTRRWKVDSSDNGAYFPAYGLGG